MTSITANTARLLLLALAALSSGCLGGTTLRPGFWMLNASGKKFDRRQERQGPQEPLITDREVEMILDWGDVDGEEVETVELHYAGAETGRIRSASPITGTIRPSSKTPGLMLLDVIGRDDSYEFQLVGKIVDDAFVEGAIIGRDPVYGDRGLQGKFTLEWLED